MQGEFTVIYEPDKRGGTRASVAELPEIAVIAQNREEAKTRLAAAIREHLANQRQAAFAHLTPDARVERIRVELLRPRPTDPHSSQTPVTEQEVLKRLYEEGLVAEIRPRLDPADYREEHEPIQVEGKPISQEIIEGRR